MRYGTVYVERASSRPTCVPNPIIPVRSGTFPFPVGTIIPDDAWANKSNKDNKKQRKQTYSTNTTERV